MFRWFFKTFFWISQNFAKFLKSHVKFEWQKIIDTFQVLRCKWTYFTCSKHLSKHEAISSRSSSSKFIFSYSASWTIHKSSVNVSLMLSILKQELGTQNGTLDKHFLLYYSCFIGNLNNFSVQLWYFRSTLSCAHEGILTYPHNPKLKLYTYGAFTLKKSVWKFCSQICVKL